MKNKKIKLLEEILKNDELYQIKVVNFEYSKIFIEKDDKLDDFTSILHVVKDNEYYTTNDQEEINDILEKNLINNIKIRFRKNPNLFKSIVKNKELINNNNFKKNDFDERIYNILVGNKIFFNFEKEIERIEKNGYNVNLIERLIKKSISENEMDFDDFRESIENPLHKIKLGVAVSENFKTIKNTIIENNNLLKLIETMDLESIEDIIVERKPYFEYEKLIKRNFKKEYSSLINEKTEKLLTKMFRTGITYDEFNSEFMPKIKRYIDSEDFFEAVKNYINIKSDWNFESKKVKFSEYNVNYKEIEDNVYVAKIENYEQSRALGSTQWCISYEKSYFDQYTEFFSEQFFIYDFNKTSEDPMSMIGFTTDIFSNVKNAHNKFDESLSNEDYEEIVKKLNIKDKNYIRQKINKTKNKFWKFKGFIKIKDFKSAQENYTGDEKFELKTLLKNIELDENTVDFLNKNKVFSNPESFSKIGFLNLKKLKNFKENIKDFDDLFVYYLNSNRIERDNIINGEKQFISDNSGIKDKLVDIFVKNPFNFYSSFYNLFDFFKENYEEKKHYNLNSNNISKMLGRSNKSKIIEEKDFLKKIISNLKKDEIVEIVEIALKSDNFVYLSLIDDKFFKDDIKEKIDNYLSKKNDFYFNDIAISLNEKESPNKIIKYISEIFFKKGDVKYTMEKKYLFKNDYIRKISFKNKLFNIEEYLNYLHYNKYVKREDFNIDKQMEKDILKLLEKAGDSGFASLLKEKIMKNKNKIKPI